MIQKVMPRRVTILNCSVVCSLCGEKTFANFINIKIAGFMSFVKDKIFLLHTRL